MSLVYTHSRQKLHSKVPFLACLGSGGRSLPQRSRSGMRFKYSVPS